MENISEWPKTSSTLKINRRGDSKEESPLAE
jgi:hypothetical protein